MTIDVKINSQTSNAVYSVASSVVYEKAPVIKTGNEEAKTESLTGNNQEINKAVKQTAVSEAQDNKDNNENEQDKVATREKLDDVVTELNSSIQSVQRNLKFSVDKDLDKLIINVTDKVTDEVVRQIPSEEALEVARILHDVAERRKSSSDAGSEGVFFNSST